VPPNPRGILPLHIAAAKTLLPNWGACSGRTWPAAAQHLDLERGPAGAVRAAAASGRDSSRKSPRRVDSEQPLSPKSLFCTTPCHTIGYARRDPERRLEWCFPETLAMAVAALSTRETEIHRGPNMLRRRCLRSVQDISSHCRAPLAPPLLYESTVWLVL